MIGILAILGLILFVVQLATRQRVDDLLREVKHLRQRVTDMERRRVRGSAESSDGAAGSPEGASDDVAPPVAVPPDAPAPPVVTVALGDAPVAAAAASPVGPPWPVTDSAQPAAQEPAPLDLSADAPPPAVPGDELARVERERKAAVLRRLEEYKSGRRVDSNDESTTADEPPAESTSPTGEPTKPKRAPGLSWEERLGARLPVWIGAVALALAGVFLVRYFSEIGLLGPAVRVSLAAAGGLAMLVIGELLRKNQARIAHGLTAAGVAVLYAALFSAVRLHSLVHPGVGFALMIAVTAAAIGLSLRHGSFVALLGLVGGFVMPALLSARGGEASHLYTYLLMLEVGLIVLTRARRWWWIGTLTMLAGFGWAIAWLALWHDPSQSAWVGAYLLGSIAVFVIAMMDSESRAASRGQAGFLRVLPWAAAIIGIILAAWLLQSVRFNTLEWVYFGVLSAGCMVLARLRDRYFGLTAVSAGMTMILLAAWTDRLGAADTGRFLATLAAMAALHLFGAYACLWGSRHPDRWALLAVVVAPLAFLIAMWGVDAISAPVDWWIVAATMAAVLAAMATPIHFRRATIAAGDDALALFVAGAVFFLSFAAHLFVNTHELGRQWVTIAWALQVPMLAYLAGRLRLPKLMPVVTMLTVLVGVRLLINPAVLRYDYGDTVVLNGIWYVYGVPAACLALAGWRLHRAGPAREFIQPLGVTAIALTLAMIAMLVRHGFHAADMVRGGVDAFEYSTYAVTLGAAGIALVMIGRSRALNAVAVCGLVAIGLMLVTAIVGAGVVGNPILELDTVGSWPVVNGLLYLYGAPAVLAAFAARQLARHKPLDEMAPVVAAAAAGLTLGLVAMQVRHGFNVVLAVRSVELFEFATYGAAFGVTGIVMLLAARRWPGTILENAGAFAFAIMLLCSLVGVGLVENPLHEHRAVGATPVFNGLLYLFGLPAVLSLVASRLLRRYAAFKGLADLAYFGMILLFFALVTLQVRQAFGGTYLDEHLTTNSEWYAYSAVWLLFAAALLTLGITLNRTPMRWASLAVLLLAVAKVFLFDTRHLEQLWRVLSFFGLGVSLMVIAWVYQRFVFRKA